eukprot:scaffold117259_cov24-Phaeocystis_antarctica.AAC.1
MKSAREPSLTWCRGKAVLDQAEGARRSLGHAQHTALAHDHGTLAPGQAVSQPRPRADAGPRHAHLVRVGVG